jgi:outer membrane protein
MRSREVVAAGLLAMLTLPCWSRAQSSDRPGSRDEDKVQAEAKAEAKDRNDKESASKLLPLQVPVSIGTIDIDQVFKRYEKVKEVTDRFGEEHRIRKNELGKIMAVIEREAELVKKLAPGSFEHKKHEDKITDLKARYDAEREQAQHDFSRLESRNLVSLYKDIQEATTSVAKARGLTYVVKMTPEPTMDSDPNTVITAIKRSVVYADPRADITDEVVRVLNQRAKSPSITKPAGN